MIRLPVLAGDAAARWIERSGRFRSPRTLLAEVQAIIDDVRGGGDARLLHFAERFDGGRPRQLRVPSERCAEALDALPPEHRAALEAARRNLFRFHERQARREDAVTVRPGVDAWREFRPIERIGVYAPGGRAAYPSSVLMAAVPARIAGVREIAVCCPAGPGGEPPDAVLAACALLEVDEVYAVGGAHAIAALALGTETMRPVDKIFGPGGAWVNAAKLALFPEVAIDLPAGPSEVTVWADATARPDWIAAELVAQAEHGPDSVVVAVLSDDDVEPDVLAQSAAQIVRAAGLQANLLVGLPREAVESSLGQGAILIAGSDTHAADWVNALAPEHLSIQRREPDGALERVRHAGSVFLGEYAPVAAGDYCSGTNHVLPTGGRARAASGLSVADFGRWMQVQRIDRDGLAELAPTIETLASWEGLPAHAAAVRARLAGAAAEPGGDA